ncbi:hypothetical protein D046_8060 [Vibrio parahaemolyticus V-223/04]|nr:hypothetical protein D046_8060 [Vibrio parahaemolyticus V-223/04]
MFDSIFRIAQIPLVALSVCKKNVVHYIMLIYSFRCVPKEWLVL